MITKPSLQAIGGQVFDPNGLGENLDTLNRANAEENQYYQGVNQQDQANGDLLGQAVHFGQAGGAQMEDPAMKVFLQALHEKQARITPQSNFQGSNSDAFSPQGMRSTALDALYTTANRKAKVAGI
jgi:hypothetical protein